jgi:hypothetical protein
MPLALLLPVAIAANGQRHHTGVAALRVPNKRYARVESEQGCAVVRPEGPAEVRDAGGIQIGDPVAIHIDSRFDDSDELHQVRDRLPDPVSDKRGGSAAERR